MTTAGTAAGIYNELLDASSNMRVSSRYVQASTVESRLWSLAYGI